MNITDPGFLNLVANHPAVLDQIGLTKLDLSNFFRNDGNVALGVNEGVALFGYRGNGVYEGHYLFTPALRGKRALAIARLMLAHMFTTRGARVIVGETPVSDRAARHFTSALGFTRRGTTTDTQGRPCVVYEMDRASWAISSAASLAVLDR